MNKPGQTNMTSAAVLVAVGFALLMLGPNEDYRHGGIGLFVFAAVQFIVGWWQASRPTHT